MTDRPRGQGPVGTVSDDDQLALVFLACGAVAFGIVNVGAISQDAMAWLIDHHVLVPESAALVPLAGGAGLDLRRVAVVAGVAIVLIALSLTRRRRPRGELR